MTFAFTDEKVGAYRRSVLHLNLNSVIDGRTLNWCEQNVLFESMSEDFLIAKKSKPDMTAVNFKNHFSERMGEVERGHIEVLPKLWNLRPYEKTNGETTTIPRLIVSYQKVRKETEDWDDYKKLSDVIPEFPLIQRMLLGADSVVHTPRLSTTETNERRMAKFSESMNSGYIGRNPAVLQYTQFAYVDKSTRRRMSNTTTPKPGRFEEDLAPIAVRGKSDC